MSKIFFSQFDFKPPLHQIMTKNIRLKLMLSVNRGFLIHIFYFFAHLFISFPSKSLHFTLGNEKHNLFLTAGELFKK